MVNPLDSIRDLQERASAALKPLGLECIQMSFAPGNRMQPDMIQAAFTVDAEVAFKDPEVLATDKAFRDIALNDRAAEKLNEHDELRKRLLAEYGGVDIPEEPKVVEQPSIDDTIDAFELPIEEVERRLRELGGE